MSESRKKELQAEIYKLKFELNKINDDELSEKNKQFIGKYFTYKNSYSRTDDDYWYEYYFVNSISEYGTLTAFNFSMDSNCEVHFRNNQDIHPDMDYKQISEDEFNKAYERIITYLQSFEFVSVQRQDHKANDT